MDQGQIKMVAAKTDRALIIPLALALKKHLNHLKANAGDESHIHPRAAATLSRLGRVGSLSNQFSMILVKAGLRDSSALNKESTGKGRDSKRQMNDLSFHSLRHAAVSLLKEAGVAQATVMEFVGHDSEQMSQHYTHVGMEALKKAADALPDVTAQEA